MPTAKLSSDQFIHDLVTCGVLTYGDIDPMQVGQRIAAQLDATELARKLVAGGKLTKYQAANALQGKAKNLVFGEYVVLAKIGAGGVGDVFKAEHRRMKRVVALRVLSAAAVKSPDAVKRFHQEAQAAARLEHVNLVTAHDAGERHGVHFLVMQYVDGRDLSSLIKERGPLPVAQAVDYILQAARGLLYAHAQGIVHHNVKPANLLLNSEGTVKLLDVGISRLDGTSLAPGERPGNLTAREMCGTAEYRSPEQAKDPRQADARTDIYSLGCTLHFLLTGESPYHGSTVQKNQIAHREQPIPSLSRRRHDVPPALDRVFARMVAKHPAERFQNMQETIAALEPFTNTGAAAVNLAWAAPVNAVSENATSLSPAGSGQALGSSGKSALLENAVVRKTWGMTAKFAGALFGTVVAPIVVAFILKYLDKPADPSPAAVTAATSSATAGGPTAPGAPGNTASASHATAAEAPPVVLAAGQPADLLPAIDLGRDTVSGALKSVGGVLQLRGWGTRQHTILRLPVEPPSEYDVMLTVSRPLRTQSDWGLVLVFALDGQQGAVVMDGARKGERFWALQEVDGKAPLDNGTAARNKPGFTDTPRRVCIKVRHGRVSVGSGEQLFFTWRGTADQLSLPHAWNALPRRPGLFLMSTSDFDVHEIRLVPGGAGWTTLFNGLDLRGWKAKDEKYWSVDTQAGVLTGLGGKEDNWLYSDQEYSAFRLRLEFSLAAGTNGGVAIRAAPEDKDLDRLQIELRNDLVSPRAGLTLGALRNAGRAKRRNLPPAVAPMLAPPGEWNELEIELHKQQLRVWINGLQIHDADLARMADAPRAAAALKRSRGRIALETTAGQVRYRNIVLHEIRDGRSPDAPADE